MHLLLDSHIMLWIVAPGSRQLSARAKRIVTEAASVQFSLVSLWELAIKAAKGQLDIDLDRLLSALDEARLQELPLRRQHNQTLRTLPAHHRDPFDRMLVAQAVAEPLHLLTCDEKLKPYSDLVILV